MTINLDHVELPPASQVAAEVRVSAPAYAAAGVSLSASGPEPTISVEGENTGHVDPVSKVTSPEDHDWNSESLQRKFALLERKVGRQATTPAEESKYFALRESRRAWVRSHTYMADYLEEQRQKAIIQKLQELRTLVHPIQLNG